jgi:ubiquinone/menaquinone biosynthesis C-methylase UbiE
MSIFFDIHCDLPREGPGDDASTGRALSLLTNLPSRPRVLDIGCGPGMQTLALAEQTDGHLIAVDTHQPFLSRLEQAARARGLSRRIQIVNASMRALPFRDGMLDVIWSEGAVYIIGFDRGLREWRRLLKLGGCVAVSELSWLRPNPPEEPAAYWASGYPDMRSIDANLSMLRAAGYAELGHFVLPASSWWTTYYDPMERRIALLRDRFRDDPEANRQLDQTAQGIALYRRYSDWYGYVFYVMQEVS